MIDVDVRELDRAQRKQYVRDALEVLGWSQLKLSEELEVSQASVCFWVAQDWNVHNTSPRVGKLEDLQKILKEELTQPA